MFKMVTTLFFAIQFNGCVTAPDGRRHDCFEFGVDSCISYFNSLDSNAKKSANGQQLFDEICKFGQVKCVVEVTSDPFPSEVTMAAQGYARVSVTNDGETFYGFFAHAKETPNGQKAVQEVLATKNAIDQCEVNELKACERLVSSSASRFALLQVSGVKKGSVAQAHDMAKTKLCSSTQYKCVSGEGASPPSTPSGWISVTNSQEISIKNGKRSQTYSAIYRRQ
jgi:hypothetical protein